MKLTGSLTEAKLKKDLLSLKEFLFVSQKGSLIDQTVKRNFPNINTYFVINYLEYQGSISVKILVNSKDIILLEFEEERLEEFELISVNDYLIGKSHREQLLLAVAVDLGESASKIIE
ncbi:hypothetical protein EHQ52_17065 [Leptospira koniambonensis]|uniref:Uncharacterized protein n=1 Tax=Leptospira koniambonensis TaxID=2484950 RepID=A0A4R9J645_9LEPT|nr:hypothetical protein [Leptospira koniambonensis]TGL31637.1 hypothetical protein EHQ52_17065 [Leptospira koniambonensis]